MQTINFDILQNLLQNPVGVPQGVGVALVAGTYNSADQQNAGRRGLKIVVDIANAGAGTVTVTIQGKDPISGKYYTILASAALAINTTTVLTVYPGAPVVANLSANDVLPATWRIVAVLATGPITATIGGSEIV